MTYYLISITLIIAALYFLISILLHVGLSRKFTKTNIKPSVSVLIAARNEEMLLPNCLTSLAKIDYPLDLLQIIIINDKSTDKTEQVANKYVNQYTHFNLINIIEKLPGLDGKMNALCQGMDQATGEIVLITDADCIVSPNWVSEMAAYFIKGVGLVGSMTLLSGYKENEKCYDRLQAMDWIFLQGIASATAGIGLPVTVLGNNFGFRKKTYEEIGGFINLDFSLTEDHALLKAIHNKTKWKIVYPLFTNTSILSNPIENLRSFYNQRKRWVKGGSSASEWGFLLMSISFLLHALVLFSLVIGIWHTNIFLSLVIIILADLSLILRLLRRFGLMRLLRYFPLFELYYILYTILFAFSLLIPGKISWKERDYPS